jgi:hypothetical protein
VSALASDVTIAVTTGTSYTVGEILLLDSERMLIVDIAGNNLTVKRAWDGTVLAAHTGSTIYAPRRLTVTRGAVGTTAATHSNGAAITRHVVPGLIKELCVAEALNTLLQETGGYSRVIGTGNARAIGQGFLNDSRPGRWRGTARHPRRRVHRVRPQSPGPGHLMFDIKAKGPVFDGRAERANRELTGACVERVAREGKERRVDPAGSGDPPSHPVLRNPDPHRQADRRTVVDQRRSAHVQVRAMAGRHRQPQQDHPVQGLLDI